MVNPKTKIVRSMKKIIDSIDNRFAYSYAKGAYEIVAKTGLFSKEELQEFYDGIEWKANSPYGYNK